MDPNSIEIIVPGVPAPHGNYPHARRYGEILFVSGVGPRFSTPTIPDGRTFPTGFVRQCDQVLCNLRKVVEHSLSQAKAQSYELFDVDIYLSESLAMNRSQFPSCASDALDRFYAEFENAIRPRVALISALPGGISIEIKARAVLRSTPGLVESRDELHQDLVFASGRPSLAGKKTSCFEAQFNSAFEDLERNLTNQGSSISRTLDVEIYLVDLFKNWEQYNLLYSPRFKSPRPTRTTIGVPLLANSALIELKAVAIG